MATVSLEVQVRHLELVGPLGHSYISLVENIYDSNGFIIESNVLRSIHGLATDFSSPNEYATVPAETGNGSNLYVYIEDGNTIGLGGTHTIESSVVSSGLLDQYSPDYLFFVDKFESAYINANSDLNDQDLRYHIMFQNSNSVARYVFGLVKTAFGLGDVSPGAIIKKPGWLNDLSDPWVEADTPRGQPFPDVFDPNYRCFAAGTAIRMADQSEKCIEDIKVGDLVLAFDNSFENGRGQLVPCRVIQTFINHNQILIDFHGLKVTPGHVFLSNNGDFCKLQDIIRLDRSVVLEDGTVVSARTNLPISEQSHLFSAVGADVSSSTVESLEGRHTV